MARPLPAQQFVNRSHSFRLPASPGSIEIYGFPFVVVDGTQAKKAVEFTYSDESDGVNHTTDQSFPFYPIPDEAIAQAHWIEGGQPHRIVRDRRPVRCSDTA